MKVLKSMMCVATLMLLSASFAFSQLGIVDVAMRDAAPTEVSFDVFLEEACVVTTQLPLSPEEAPVKVQIMDREGNVLCTLMADSNTLIIRATDRGVVLPNGRGMIEVSQVGVVIICDDLHM